jgi:exodeoxyribonuclease-3
VKIATWNVNSIAARLPLVERWLEAARPDVVCFQEIKCTTEKYPYEALSALGYESVVHGQRTYNGVAIASRSPVADVRIGMPDDPEDAPARMISAVIGGIRVVDVYIPNGSFVGSEKYAFKLEWLARLRRAFDETLSSSDEVLLCGDFNVAPEARDVHDPAAWEGKVLFSEPEREAIETVRAWGLVDAYRQHHDAAGHYSWWDYRAASFRRNAGLRIDHVWVTEPLAARTTGAWIDKETRAWERPSDHAPVVVEIA